MTKTITVEVAFEIEVDIDVYSLGNSGWYELDTGPDFEADYDKEELLRLAEDALNKEVCAYVENLK